MRSRAKHEGGGVPVWSGLSEGTFFTGTATGAQARTTGDTRETARLRGAVETEPSLEYVQCGLVVGIVITYTHCGATRTARGDPPRGRSTGFSGARAASTPAAASCSEHHDPTR